MSMSMMQQFRNMEAQLAGTAVGALAGLLSSWSENRDAHDTRRDGDLKFLRDSVESLKGQVQSQARPPQPLEDFQRGILSGVYVKSGESIVAADRPPLWTSSEQLNYPPAVTTRNSQGLIASVGEMARFGHRLDLPEVRAAITGMQLYGPGFETNPEQIAKIITFFNAVMTSALSMGIAPVQPLIPQQLAALAAQIAADSGSKAAVNNLFTSLLSQAGQAVMGGIGSVGTLTPAQTALLVNYFNSLVGSIIAAGGTAAVSAWIASACPALADPALDALWSYTYNPSTLSGTPTLTSAGLGGVVVNTAVVASCVFYFIVDSNEQQTARRFRVKIVNLSTAAAGQACRFYLPKALAGNVAPKVTVGVEGNTQAQAGYPYISAVAGGATPYFDLYVVAGTNSATWYAILDVTR